jgi:hypothetical protein
VIKMSLAGGARLTRSKAAMSSGTNEASLPWACIEKDKRSTITFGRVAASSSRIAVAMARVSASTSPISDHRI